MSTPEENCNSGPIPIVGLDSTTIASISWLGSPDRQLQPRSAVALWYWQAYKLLQLSVKDELLCHLTTRMHVQTLPRANSLCNYVHLAQSVDLPESSYYVSRTLLRSHLNNYYDISTFY
jgi:hypothetical protein